MIALMLAAIPEQRISLHEVAALPFWWERDSDRLALLTGVSKAIKTQKDRSVSALYFAPSICIASCTSGGVCEIKLQPTCQLYTHATAGSPRGSCSMVSCCSGSQPF